MDNWDPQRGDVVRYRDQLFFFQSNGMSCYLYRYRDEVGCRSRAVYGPARHHLQRPTKEEATAYINANSHLPREMLTVAYPCVPRRVKDQTKNQKTSRARIVVKIDNSPSDAPQDRLE